MATVHDPCSYTWPACCTGKQLYGARLCMHFERLGPTTLYGVPSGKISLQEACVGGWGSAADHTKQEEKPYGNRKSVACVQVIWPWSPPFPFPEKEGMCMDMTTDPSLLQKRKVVSSHYHHHRSPLSDEKGTSGHDHHHFLSQKRKECAWI